jgi:hypothetical protein
MNPLIFGAWFLVPTHLNSLMLFFHSTLTLTDLNKMTPPKKQKNIPTSDLDLQINDHDDWQKTFGCYN